MKEVWLQGLAQAGRLAEESSAVQSGRPVLRRLEFLLLWVQQAPEAQELSEDAPLLEEEPELLGKSRCVTRGSILPFAEPPGEEQVGEPTFRGA